jgi:hypothetical protein
MGQCVGERVGTTWVVRLTGRFLTDQDAVLIEEAMSSMPADARCLVVNWSAILTINSTSLGAAMKGEMDLMKRGGHYRNCAFSDRAARIVRPFRKSFPWNYFDTEAQAVQACSSDEGDHARLGTEHPKDRATS